MLLLGSMQPSEASTSAEANNPFNEFMSPSGGVNMFSGDVAFDHPVHTLMGRNGLQFPVVLHYSGNVHLNVRARNDRMPSDWLGLGWRLGFGNIRCDHGETGILADDRCFYVSPKGVSQEILQKGKKFFLEMEPFWSVQRTVSSDGQRILGWTLTDVSGRKFEYGDMAENPASVRNATRYIFWWSAPNHPGINYVGSGFSGSPTLYPFQWDLAREVDIAGNAIRYSYDQDLAQVRQEGFTLPVQYTRGSRCKAVFLDGGGSVEFQTRNKLEEESFDPDAFYPEPDAFLEFQENRYLEAIIIKNIDDTPIRTVRLGYEVTNFQADKSAGYSKRFLARIVEEGVDGVSLGTHRFSYAKGNPDDESLPLGVLTQMDGPNCGKVRYHVEQKQILGSQKILASHHFRRFGKNARIFGGRLKNAEEFVLVVNGKDGEDGANEIFIFNNEDGNWKEHWIQGIDPNYLHSRRLGLDNGSNVKVVAGEGYFAVIKKVNPFEHRVSVFYWDTHRWSRTSIQEKSFEFGSDPHLQMDGNTILIHHHDGSLAKLITLHRQGENWIESVSEANLVISGIKSRGPHLLYYGLGPDSFGDASMARLRTWNGTEWIATDSWSYSNYDDSYRLGDGFMAGVETVDLPQDKHFARISNWNGYAWQVKHDKLLDKKSRVRTDCGGSGICIGHALDIQAVGNGFAAFRSDDQDHLHLFQFTGEKWKTALNRDMVGSSWDWFEANWHGDAYADALLVRSPRTKWKLWAGFFPVKELDRDARLTAFNRIGTRWAETNFGLMGYPNTGKKPVLGQDFFALNSNPGNAHVWNGTSWKPQAGERPFKKDALSLPSASLLGEMSDGELSLYRKFQNGLQNPVYAFVVTRKEVVDPVRGSTSVYRYEYDTKTGRYDIRTASAKFHRATVHLPSHGRMVYWFHNGSVDRADPANLAGEDRRLAGNVFREEEFDAAGKRTTERVRTLRVFQKEAEWPPEARSIQLAGHSERVRGVASSKAFFYHPANGLPTSIEETGSQGRKRITQTRFAHEVPQYAGLLTGGRHMLSQVAETRVYEGSAESANLQAYRVQTWSASGNAWHPVQTWEWAGRRTQTVPAFEYANPSLNQRPWKLIGTVSRRDGFGRIVQETKPKGSSNCVQFGHRGEFAVARIENAACEEVAVLTGDFSDPSPVLVDATNGWKRNQAALSASQARFGEASLHLPPGAVGPGKHVGPVVSGRDYLFSAWVYPVSISASSPVALVLKKAGGVEINPPGSRFGSLLPGSTHGWQRVLWRIPSSLLDVPEYDISVEARGAAEFYIQDLRFHPEKALVTTEFLDKPSYLSNALVSEAGAARYQEYDGGMRLLKTYVENDQGRKVLRSELTYNLDQCGEMQGARGNLTILKSSTGYIPFDKQVRNYGDQWIDPVTERVRLDFRPENPFESVTLRVNGGPWNPPCCRGEESVDIPLSSATTVVEVRAGNGAPYRLALRKPSSCWTPLGGQVSGGWAGLPAALQQGGDRWAAYRADQDGGRLRVKRWSVQTQQWNDVGGAVSTGEVGSIVLRLLQGAPHVAYVDEIQVTQPNGRVSTETRAMVKRWNGSDWVPLHGDGSVSRGTVRSLAFDGQGGTLWIAFVGDAAAEEGREDGATPAYARKWNGSVWEPAKRVSDGSALDLSLAILPDGTPRIAYLGSFPFVRQGPRGPENLRSGALPIVKKLITQDGITFWGDLRGDSNGRYTDQGEVWNLPEADRLQLAVSGSDLLLAVSYAKMKPVEGEADTYEETGTRFLEVRKFRPDAAFTDGSHWFPLAAGTTPEEYAVTPMDKEGEFHLTAGGSVPTLAFVNAHNRQRATVVEFTGGRWSSVGLPAMLTVDQALEPGRLAVSASAGAPTTAFARQDRPEEEATRHAIRAVEYSGSCPDLALSNLRVLEGTSQVPFEWAFKPYLLSYRGTVSAMAGAASLALTPSNLASLSKVWVGSRTGPTQEWTSGQPFPSAFPVALGDGANVLWVELVSADGHHRLRYEIELRRSSLGPLAGNILIRDHVLHPSFTVDHPGPYTILVPADKPSILISVDAPPQVGVYVDGRPQGRGETIEVKLPAGSTLIKVVLVGEDGTRREYEIQADRGVPSAPVVARLDGVTRNADGTFTARFGYHNPEASERHVPVGASNLFRYQGASGLDRGQPTRFQPGLVTNAFAVLFDGTPLTWNLLGQSVTATGMQAPRVVQVEMKETALSEPNISKPQLRITNLSTGPLSGFKVSLWLSRAEVPYQEIVADPYYFQPSGIQMAVSSPAANQNLVRLDLVYPPGFVLTPGASTDAAGVQLGLHFRNYYPGQWNWVNDWSWQGIGPEFRATTYVTVYGSDGSLLGGIEPAPDATPPPPPLTQAAVFSMDGAWAWSIGSGGGLSPSLNRRTQGSAALEVEGTGYLQLAHMPMKTTDLSGEAARLLVDFYLPNGQSNPWWKGQVQLIADCPSAGLHSTYIGQVELTPLPNGQFSTLSFNLPAQILSVLGGDWRDFQFKWVLNINQAAEKPVLDNMRFTP